VPRDRDVRVVAHRLGRLDQAVDEAHRADEVAAGEGLDDRLAGALPAGQLRQPRLDLRVVQECHPKLCCHGGFEDAMSETRPTLWHISLSHYSEKVRWALDHKQIPHRRRAVVVPGAHMVAAAWLTRDPSNFTFQVLELDGEAIA